MEIGGKNRVEISLAFDDKQKWILRNRRCGGVVALHVVFSQSRTTKAQTTNSRKNYLVPISVCEETSTRFMR